MIAAIVWLPPRRSPKTGKIRGGYYLVEIPAGRSRITQHGPYDAQKESPTRALERLTRGTP